MDGSVAVTGDATSFRLMLRHANIFFCLNKRRQVALRDLFSLLDRRRAQQVQESNLRRVMSFYFVETMSCTFQSAFQRQLFIKAFSGTYNHENVATDVRSARGAVWIIHEL